METQDLLIILRAMQARYTNMAADKIEELLRANETLRNEVATLAANLEAAAEYRHRAEVALQEALQRG